MQAGTTQMSDKGCSPQTAQLITELRNSPSQCCMGRSNCWYVYCVWATADTLFRQAEPQWGQKAPWHLFPLLSFLVRGHLPPHGAAHWEGNTSFSFPPILYPWPASWCYPRITTFQPLLPSPPLHCNSCQPAPNAASRPLCQQAEPLFSFQLPAPCTSCPPFPGVGFSAQQGLPLGRMGGLRTKGLVDKLVSTMAAVTLSMSNSSGDFLEDSKGKAGGTSATISIVSILAIEHQTKP